MRKTQTADVFAIKAMGKVKMGEKVANEMVVGKRDILNKVDNEYVMRGVYTIQTKKSTFIL